MAGAPARGTGTRARPASIERSGRALGSALRLTLAFDGTGIVRGWSAHASTRLADAAWAEVVATFAEVDLAMSRFREDSELTALNRRAPGSVDRTSRMLARALAAADRAFRVTRGRFDPRVVAALERIGYVGVPQGNSPAAPRTATDRVLVRDGRHGPVALPVPVDLGGIGKGLALRWAAHRLAAVLEGRAAGFLLEAGGDIVVGGGAPDGGPWKVGIENQAGGSDPLAVLVIEGSGAVATSSTSQLRWPTSTGVAHHLIDPRTGEPGGEGLLAVTVAGPDPAWAEVWSKALFLEGTRGIADAARRRGLAAWWAGEDGRFEMTPAARVRTIWVAAEA